MLVTTIRPNQMNFKATKAPIPGQSHWRVRHLDVFIIHTKSLTPNSDDRLQLLETARRTLTLCTNLREITITLKDSVLHEASFAPFLQILWETLGPRIQKLSFYAQTVNLHHITMAGNFPNLTNLEVEVMPTSWNIPRCPSLFDDALISMITFLKGTLVSFRLTGARETDFSVVLNSVGLLPHLRNLDISFGIPHYENTAALGAHLSRFLLKHGNGLETLVIRRGHCIPDVYFGIWIRDVFPKFTFPSLHTLTLLHATIVLPTYGIYLPSELNLTHFPCLEKLLVPDTSLQVSLDALLLSIPSGGIDDARMRHLELTLSYLSGSVFDIIADKLPTLEALDLSYRDYGPYLEDKGHPGLNCVGPFISFRTSPDTVAEKFL
ncbi:hypothetical protein C0991_010005 [Blastosporella zonata]|nr:hypothetical protein C0991_010005 [Blastosporella zonata]